MKTENNQTKHPLKVSVLRDDSILWYITKGAKKVDKSKIVNV